MCDVCLVFNDPTYEHKLVSKSTQAALDHELNYPIEQRWRDKAKASRQAIMDKYKPKTFA